MLKIRFKEKTNTWPGFVDLFSNLVIILVFLLIVFVFLWTTTNVFSAKKTNVAVNELKNANAAQTEQIAKMTADGEEAKQLLLMSKTQIETMQQELNVSQDEKNALAAQMNELNIQISGLNAALENAKLDAAARESLAGEVARLNELLRFADQRAAEQATEYAAMSERLNKAMAEKIAELGQYQSQFYGAIRGALAGSGLVDTSSDRFVVPSDILFARGSYKLSDAGRTQIRQIAPAIISLESKIPMNVNWIIRVDGHTDNAAVIPGTRDYKNNLELSLLRARAVVAELTAAGVDARRLVPSGFGDMYPITTDAANLQRNRRIELRLTNP
ncbi:MAG: OmpA family protein [Rickettsiales bacterium]|jgi:chemotaxis protein MotB|nr:OmpA family protein [Rickettsiales bacterium]